MYKGGIWININSMKNIWYWNFYSIIALSLLLQVSHCTGSTALDFMDPRFIIYMTSAFQRYVTLLLCFGDFFRVRSFPIMLWLRPFWLGLNELAAVTKEPTFWLWIVMAHLGQKLRLFNLLPFYFIRGVTTPWPHCVMSLG